MTDRYTQDYLLDAAEKLAKAKLYNKAYEDIMMDFEVRISDLEKARKEFFDWLNQEPNEKLKKAYRRYKDSFLNAEPVKDK